jgi:RNA polymerase sigma-70 factor (ECF subfamily)
MRNPLESPSDERLMHAAIQGDSGALGVLFERHHADVYAYCARILMDRDAAADLLQETFMRVHRYRHGFSGDSRFRPWLFRVARNACRDHLSRASKRTSTEAEWLRDRPLPASEAPSDVIVALEQALARLPADDRELLVLKRLHELSYAEIATIVGCSEGAARVRMHRAFARLQQACLEKERVT